MARKKSKKEKMMMSRRQMKKKKMLETAMSGYADADMAGMVKGY